MLDSNILNKIILHKEILMFQVYIIDLNKNKKLQFAQLFK